MTIAKTKKAQAGGNRDQGKSSTKTNDTIHSVDIESIFPSPENDDVYGKIDSENHELVMLCKQLPCGNGARR